MGERLVKVTCTLGKAQHTFEFIVGSAVSFADIEEIAYDEAMRQFKYSIEVLPHEKEMKNNG